MERSAHRWRNNALLAAVATAAFSLTVQATAATKSVPVKASVVKPLVLTSLQGLDFGTVILSGPGTWAGATVGLTRSGVLTCGANLTCVGPAMAAQYSVSGTNKRVVLINAPSVSLVNQADPTQTLTLATDAPASLTLTNSGPQGTSFAIGGHITLSSSTSAGTYAGTFNVTVDYQ